MNAKPGCHLVIQRAFLGDAVLSLPLVRNLRQRFPEDAIAFVCRKGLGDLIRAEFPVDLVFEVSKATAREDLLSAKTALAAHRVEHVICPHPSPRSAWFVGQIKRAGEAIGYQEWWNAWAFTKRVKKLPHLPEALKQLSLLAPLNREVARLLETVTPTHPLANATDTSQNLVFRGSAIPLEWRIGPWKSPGPIPVGSRVLIAPGSQWTTKRWTPEGYAEVAKQLRGLGYRIEWIGSPEERDLCENVRVLSGGAPEENRAGAWSLPEVVKEMRASALVVANDSGAVHLAALAGTPVIAVFGPTVPAQGFRPWMENAALVQQPLACRPCGKHGHTKCPIGTHECMKALPEARVREALASLGIAING